MSAVAESTERKIVTFNHDDSVYKYLAEGAIQFALPVDDVRTAFRRVLFAKDTLSSSRYALSCVCLEFDGCKMAVVATNGRHIMRWVTELPVALFEERQRFLVPKNIAKDLATLGKTAYGTVKFTVYQTVSDSGLHVEWNIKSKTKVSRGVSEGRFPNWEDIYKDASGKDVACTISGKAEDLRRILPSDDHQYDLLFSDTEIITKKSKVVPLSRKNGDIKVQLADEDRLSADISLDIELFRGFLENGCDDEDRVELRVTSQDEPIQGCLDGEIHYVLMPCTRKD